MQKLIIQGGLPLQGEVSISGAKNAALPVLCAALLTAETLTVKNVPALQDIATMLSLLKQMGTTVITPCASEVSLSAATLTNLIAPYEMVRKSRSNMATSMQSRTNCTARVSFSILSPSPAPKI
jgi:UDP-N-acetylglucosamine 1-carboxyvinyltransferase